MFRTLARRVAVPLVVAVALIAGVGAVPATAAVPTAGSTGACSPGSLGRLPWCFGITDRQTTSTLASGTVNCPGANQFYSQLDATNVNIQWTYSNGTHACVKVAYSGVNDLRSCEYWFFVPAEHATGTIIFGWWDYSYVKHYASIFEGNKVGWNFAFRAAGVERIEFQDNNGESGTSIGWANQHNYGFWVDNCV